MSEVKLTVKKDQSIEVCNFDGTINNITLLEALELYYKTNINTTINIKSCIASESCLKILYLICNNIVPNELLEYKEMFPNKLSLENEFFELYICIPYRARGDNLFRRDHLKEFYKCITKFLKNISFKLVVLEQNNNLPFNRGLLLNVGFLECEKQVNSKIKYYCHHNCDLLPEDSTLDYSYTCIKSIRDLFGYHSGLGGICIINRNDFRNINGFCNNMWAWGSEDLCIKQRADKQNIKVIRTQYNSGVKEFSHIRDGSSNSINSEKINNNNTGLKNIKYIIDKKYINKIVFDSQDFIEAPNIIHYLINCEI
jgi:hypothetical protein